MKHVHGKIFSNQQNYSILQASEAEPPAVILRSPDHNRYLSVRMMSKQKMSRNVAVSTVTRNDQTTNQYREKI